MLNTVLAYATNTFVVAVVALVLGVVFSTKIKDFFAGVPSDTRSVLSAVENDVKNKLAMAKLDVLARVAPAAVKPVVAPPAPVVLVPPAPAVPHA